MPNFRLFLFFFLSLIFFIGCSPYGIFNPPPGGFINHPTYGYVYKDYRVEIYTDPPGANIEWNDGYVGKSPVYVVLDGPQNDITLVANPVIAGQERQIKYFSKNRPIPKTIFMDMRMKSINNNQINVNLNQ